MAPPLLQARPRHPHLGVVGHVVPGAHLHLGLARVDDEDHVVIGDGGLGDVGGEDDLERRRPGGCQWNAR